MWRGREKGGSGMIPTLDSQTALLLRTKRVQTMCRPLRALTREAPDCVSVFYSYLSALKFGCTMKPLLAHLPSRYRTML